MNKKQFIKRITGILDSHENGWFDKEKTITNIELMIYNYKNYQEEDSETNEETKK